MVMTVLAGVKGRILYSWKTLRHLKYGNLNGLGINSGRENGQDRGADKSLARIDNSYVKIKHVSRISSP